MDDFPGLLAQDFGYKPQGKSAPMAPPRKTTSSSVGIGSGHRSNSYHSAKSAPIFDDHDRSEDQTLFSNVFGGRGPPKYSDQLPRSGSAAAASPSFDYDAIFKQQDAKSSSFPVFDKPVYDEDIFDGLPGIKSVSPSAAAVAPAKFDDVFTSSMPSPKQRGPAQGGSESSAFDNLFADLGKEEHGEQAKRQAEKDASPAFDDLLQGFGRSSSPAVGRSTSESNRSQKPSSDLGRTASVVMDDPFANLNSTLKTPTSSSGLLADPLEEISKFSSSGIAKVDNLYGNKGVFDDLDPLENLGSPIPPVSTEINKGGKDRGPFHSASIGDTYSPDFPGHSEPVFDMPAASESHRPAGHAASASSPSRVNAGADDTNFIPRSENVSEAYDDIWLTVSEVPLFTQPTTAPPPSRPPPPRPPCINKSRTGAFSSPNSRRKVHEYSSLSNSQSPISTNAESNSVMDELDDFAMGRTSGTTNEHADFFSEDVDTSSADASAAAMKVAMDKAEAKFRQMREREYLKTARSKEAVQVDQDIQDMQQRESRERQERIDHDRQQWEREEEEREQMRLEKERGREEKEREQRRLEREREKGKYAVERATREARDRAAIEARARAERAAADKATAEARQRAERAAVQRAQAEARERAAADARERAGKVAAEARERANAEAREKEAAARSAALKAEVDSRTRAERAAVERAAAEARQRAAAAAARANQQRTESSQKNEDDLESFFSSRASSAPRPRATTKQDPFFDTHSKGGPETTARTSVASTTNLRKASSTTNIVDDLSSIFGAGAPSGEFQEVEGETEDRRRARMERQYRTQERAARALAEKNQRDLQVQREQAERHRIGETLDVEIKRWSAGKESNLRALLSTLQYVLWPECGWQPVSLTDLITGASVKKAYRKATLCIHPDKVQQKGATLQQKYIAEKVFDLLKEAWNKFNSEELF